MFLTSANILLIENDKRVIDSIRQIIGDRYALDIETRGPGAVKKAISKEYDLYLIAYRLPDMSGVDVLSGILARFPEAICVMMDHDPDIDAIMKIAHMGGYDFLKTPVRHEKLERVILRASERRWYIREARRLKAEKNKNLIAISEEQSRLRSVINSIDDGLIITNQRKEIIFNNPRFLNLIGVRREIPVGEKIFDILPRKLQEQITNVLDNRNSSCSVKEEIVIEPPARLVVMANTTPILDDNGYLLGAVSVLRDISEIKALELSKSEFINMVAHELKAPLGAIKGYLEMVIDRALGDDEARYQQYLERSLERSNAMLSLLQDLLNIFRMDARTVHREIERLDGGALIRETAEFFRGELREKHITLSMDIAGKIYIHADKEEIRRVFTNLLSNAIKYNKEGGSIHITAKRTGEHAKFTVKDTGIGMKEEEKAHLFEEFYRAKNLHTRKISGTGLGMTILKKILDNYHGRVLVESKYGKGSTFTVLLPPAEK